jgi:hypothetical protein
VALVAALIGGSAAAIAVPLGRPGVGWPLTGLALTILSWVITRTVAARPAPTAAAPPDPTPPGSSPPDPAPADLTPTSATAPTPTPAPAPAGQRTTRSRLATNVWAATALGLLTLVAWRASEWLAPLCLLCAAVAGSLAVAGGRSVRGLVLGVLAIPVLTLPALGWAGRGLTALRGRSDGTSGPGSALRIAAAGLVGIVLLVIFAPLLAGADPAFGRLLDGLIPTIDLPSFRRVFLFGIFGLGTLAAGYVLCSPARADPPAIRTRKLRRIEWALPIGLLFALFATFVGVACSTMFGGDEHVLRTTGLTYAEYARGGFWQLLAVSVLTLPVIMVAARHAETSTAADRAWLRGLLGGVAVLTLLIVASAMSRMWAYQQAYGFTVLRVLVSAMELWLGVVYLLLMVAGRRLAAPWMPRAILGTGLAALLALGCANPDRFISDRNVTRWQQTGKIDLWYLSQLSADAVPALMRLAEPLRTCVLAPIAADLAATPDGWREWNAGRAAGRAVLPGPQRPVTGCGAR